MMIPQFSIIIPLFNAEAYITQCLESIRNQTYKEFEVWIIDDGSTDHSASVVQDFLSDERFHYYYQENRGVSAARNQGISKAKGAYIAFIDSDDFIDEDYLELFAQAIHQKEYDVICTGYKTTLGQRVQDFYGKDYTQIGFLKQVLAGTGGVVWGKVYKKQLIIDYSVRFSERYNMREDLLFNLIFSNFVQDVFVINAYNYNYRLLEVGLSSSKTKGPNLNSSVITEIFNILGCTYSANEMATITSKFLQNLVFWDCISCVTDKMFDMRDIIQTQNFKYVEEYMIIQGFKEQCLFGFIKKRHIKIATFIYWLWSKARRI